MERVYRTYERRKREASWVDFEDLLELAIRMLDEDENALATVRDRYRAFTVDEYQDVNLLQQTLLERWLGDRDDLCIVGDDYQSIYGFTGAGPEHLLAMPRRYPHATIVRLEENYRSTPQVLAFANRLVPRLGGAEKVLRAARAAGPEPVVQPFASPEAETAWIVGRVRALSGEGVPLEEVAVLCRTNARLADFEEVFHDARIPFQGSALLQREAARMLLRRLRERSTTSVHLETRRLAAAAGWVETPPERLGERELVRQNDLGRLVRLAEEFDDGERTTREFVSHLEDRFGSRGTERRGVHLLTLHSAKGLEFDAVFLPRVEEKELPAKPARTPAEIAEERRLLYVGLTRAERHLAVTWSRNPSRFLEEIGVAPAGPPQRVEIDDPIFGALRAWRRERAKADEVPAYVVFHDATLSEIAGRRPRTLGELAHVPGVGPAKLDRYGSEVLAALADAPN